MSSISSLEFLESSEFCVFFLILSSSSIFLMALPSSDESDLGELGPSVMLTLRPLLDSNPKRGQHLGHVTIIEQSEDIIQVT